MNGYKTPILLVFVAMLGVFTLSAQGPKFVQNQGQWDERVAYRAILPNGFLFFENQALTYLFYDELVKEWIHPGEKPIVPGELWHHAYQIKFSGANDMVLEGRKPGKAYHNFYLGNNPEQWAGGVPEFSEIRGKGLYEGVDLLMYNKNGKLKYDFILAPGVNPAQIQLLATGLDKVFIQNGELHLKTRVNEVVEKAPFAYQLIGNEIVEVKCAWKLEEGVISFDLGAYSAEYQLIIDPELSFASYSGSYANNFGFTATDDLDGNLYSGSIAYDSGYPTTIGAFQVDYNGAASNYIDVALSKFSADGSQLVFSTYLGGSGQEMPHSIIVNSLNQLIVLGNTGSSDFPTTAGSYDTSFNGGDNFNFLSVNFGNMTHSNGCDIFVTCFSEDGTSLIGSTFIGGTDNDGLNSADMLNYNYGDVFRGEVIVDDNDRIYVASITSSADFPIAGLPAQSDYGGGETDAVLFRLSPTLSALQWSTYWGGIGDDSGYSVQVDAAGMAFMAGGTKSSGLPGMTDAPDNLFNGAVDGYLAKFNTTGGPVMAATYMGTGGYDQCYFVQLDGSGNAFVIGQTKGNMPHTAGIYYNQNGKQFVQKYSNNLSELLWSTIFGSGGSDIDISPSAFLVSDCDQIYVSGWGGTTNNLHSDYVDTSSTDGLPISADAYQSNTDGSDFYLMVLGPDASDLVYGTFFGGDDSNEHVDGGTSKFDKRGSVYQAVCAGCGGNDDFPTSPGAWSQQNNSSCNLGVFKFDLAQINAVLDVDGPGQVCEGAPAQFINLSQGGTEFLWTFGDDESSTDFEPAHEYESPGIYTITLVVLDDNDCLQPDTASIEIEVIAGVNPQIAPYNPLCLGQSTVLTGIGSENGYWIDDPSLDIDGINATASPAENTTYYFADFNACETDTVEVFVELFIPAYSIGEDEDICIGESVQLSSAGGILYEWQPAQWLDNANIPNPEATPVETTTFYLYMETPEGCQVNDSIVVTVYLDPPGGQVYDPMMMCDGVPVQLSANNGSEWSWSPGQWLNDPEIQNPWANPPQDTQFTVDIVNACGTGTDTVWVYIIFPQAEASPDTAVCFGTPLQLWASGGVAYNWTPAESLNNSQLSEPVALAPESTTYYVNVTDEYGCVDTEDVNVTIWPLPPVEAGSNAAMEWFEQAVISGYVNEEHNFWWSPEEYTDCFNCLETYVFPDTSMYFVLNVQDEHGCVSRDSVLVQVYGPLYVPNTFTPDADGDNDVFYAYGVGLFGFEMQIFNRWGEMIYRSTDPKEGWDGKVNSTMSQIDTYIWRVYFDDLKRGRQLRLGHVNLVR
jgi:gliding motility-associated-like protein